jgi:hypothetical protein
MDDLVDRIVAHVNVDRSVAEQSLGIILDFLMKEGPSEKVHALVAELDGAQAALQAAADAGDLGGAFGGLGGIIGVGARLMALNLGMSDIRKITQEVMAYSRERAGEDTVNEVVAAIPGLSQFL